MSKAIVNMTPNPSDIQTIHCSQGDTEAREWEFELHNNGEVIDPGEITEQMVFKSYKGGTEQILPENEAVPVTAPFVGDIKYPDAMRTDQEFLHRQSPTEEDGNAKIKKLYGNTLVWNQLFEPLSDSSFTISGVTVTIQNGKYTLSGTATDNGGRTRRWNNSNVSLKANHKYLLLSPVNLMVSNASTYAYEGQFNAGVIRSYDSDVDVIFGLNVVNGTTYNQSGYVNFFDLTAMGLDSLTVDEFTSLFPKPYYDYCQGAMLSFGGRNVKFNQLVQNGNFADTSKWSAESGATLSISNNIATISSTTENNGIRQYFSNPLTVTHKYLIKAEFNVPTEYRCVIGTGSAQGVQTDKLISTANTWTEVSGIGTCTASTTAFYCFVRGTTYENVKIRNVMCFDLTEMFGAGNEPSAEGFKELFPNDYYDYTTFQYMNLGQPLSMKTTGKNQVANKVRGFFSVGSSAISVDNDSESVVFYAIKGKTYVASSSVTLNRNAIARCDTPNLVNGSPVYDVVNLGNNTEKKWTATWMGWTVWYVYNSRNEAVENSAQVEIGTTPSSFESYAESNLSIPLDEFPNGMDGINDARDEKNETGYVKRMGIVDLGNLEWSYNSTYGMYSTGISNSVKKPSASSIRANAISTVGTFTDWATFYASGTSSGLWAINTSGYIGIATTETNSTTFKNSVKGKHLVYELATPLENYGVVDLGTLTWQLNGTRMQADIGTTFSNWNYNQVCAKYTSNEAIAVSSPNVDKVMGVYRNRILIYDSSFADPSAFKQAVSGVYLLYEKQNHQGFTTATLVTENGEVALANENGVLVGKCNSDVSADAGFIEGKIKLSDSDGDVYSNKIQIHVERMPE